MPLPNHPPPDDVITVVSISSFEEDHSFLRHVFNHPNWQIHAVRSEKEGIALVRKEQAAIVISDEHLPDGSWKGVLQSMGQTPDAPPLIVTSRLADDRLWAEVLNLGGYDLLMKPLDRTEVVRVLHLAWRHWKSARERARHNRLPAAQWQRASA